MTRRTGKTPTRGQTLPAGDSPGLRIALALITLAGAIITAVFIGKNGRAQLNSFGQNGLDSALLNILQHVQNHLAFAADLSGNWEIYVVNADGSNLERLTEDNADDVSLAQSPDSQCLAFVTERTGNREIYTMDMEGGQLQNRTKKTSLMRILRGHLNSMLASLS